MFGPNALASGVRRLRRVTLVPRASVLVALFVCASTPGCGRGRHDGAASQVAPGQIEGAVTAAALPRGAPVVVKLERSGGLTVAETKAQVGGRFRFRDVLPGHYLLSASGADFAAASLALQVQASERLATVLRLQEPGRLEGIVVDKAGQPVPEALVLVWRGNEAPALARNSVSDDQGRFSVAGLPPSSVTLLVQAPGIGSVKWDNVALPSRPLRVVLEGVSRGLSGEVVGVRSGDVKVRLGGSSVRHTRTAGVDAQGRFQFQGLGAGEYCLRAATMTHASQPVPAAVVASDVSGVRLPLEVGEGVSGRVIDGQGKALAGARVSVATVPPDDCPEVVTADVVGYFSTLALPRGRYQITARLPGFVGLDPVQITINARPSPMTLKLLRGARVVGQIQFAGGASAANAQVTLTAPAGARYPRDRVPVVTGHLPLAAEAAALGTRGLPHVVSTRSATTDARGLFVLQDVRPGDYGLRVSHEQGATVDVRPRAVGEGAQADFGVIRLTAVKTASRPPEAHPTITPAMPPGDRTVAGSVRDPRGKLLENVALTVRPPDPLAVPVTSATTDERGAFTLSRLPDAPLILRAQHAEYGVLSREIGPKETLINVRFPIPGGVEGEIVDGQGRFVSGGTVSLVGADGLAGPPVQMSGAGFRALGIPPGRWTLEVVVPHYKTVQRVVEVPSATTARETSVKGLRVEVRTVVE